MNQPHPQPSQPPESAAPADSVAKKSPASAPAVPSSPPRKRGSFVRRLFLAFLLAAAGGTAYVYYHPEILTRVAPGLADKFAQPTHPTQPTKTDPAKTDRPAQADEPVPVRADPTPVPDPRVDEITSEMSSLRRQMAEMESRLNQVDAATRAGRAADSANTRLLLAAMLLQSDGNTSAAAAALRRIADAESLSPELTELARAEALRLEQTPERGRILNHIAELRRLLRKFQGDRAGPGDDSAVGKIGEFLRGAFNVSRREGAESGPTESMREAILTDLARLEFFLFANNRAEYRLSLESALEAWGRLKTPEADPNIELKFQLLRRLGAPDYRLNLPLDKP